ncbi:MAG: alpha-ketoglutarate-dependent dioxygenase AlkB, partial [Polaromonas sp.]
WTSSRTGYRYTRTDPVSDQPWPAMPACFVELAASAAAVAGFEDFRPDACLVNSYVPGARLSLHQDRDEGDMRAPIVSVSLGLPAVFLFGSTQRSDRPSRYRLAHGDVAVWGGPSRLAYHGVAPLADGEHALLGRRRINLTFRRAGARA